MEYTKGETFIGDRLKMLRPAKYVGRNRYIFVLEKELPKGFVIEASNSGRKFVVKEILRRYLGIRVLVREIYDPL